MKFRFSIVVPTRNRPLYLRHCIASILANNFDSFELLISDNSDPQESEITRATSLSFNDHRIFYVRPESPPLAMSRHWEFAIRHAQGEYVLLVGDDDGLLPSTLEFLDRILKETRLDVVQWPYAFYTWPNKSHLDEARLSIRNYLWNGAVNIEKISIDSLLSDSRIWDRPHDVIPMLYNSAVSMKLCKQIFSGDAKVLITRSPDVYSGLLIAHAAKVFGRADVPLSIAGRSPVSNGAANLESENPEENAIAKDFKKLNEQDGIVVHGAVPHINVMAAEIAANLEVFYEKTNFARCSLHPKSVDFIDLLVNQILGHPASVDSRIHMLSKVAEHYAESVTLRELANRHKQFIKPHKRPLATPPCVFSKDICILTCNQINLENVELAAKMADAILSLNHRTIRTRELSTKDPQLLEHRIKSFLRPFIPPIVLSACRLYRHRSPK